MKLRGISAYKNGSRSAKDLSLALGIPIIKKVATKCRPRDGDVYINWGGSSVPDEIQGAPVINDPQAVATAANKLHAFRTWGQKPYICPWTTDIGVAKRWVAEGHTVVCRTILNGHSGAGIVLATNMDELVPAPLYTKYIKKRDEYRVHYMDNQVHVARKAQRRDFQGQRDARIRNVANGYIFQIHDFVPPQCVIDAATQAIQDLGLDFGAADVVYNEFQDRAYVIEVNTAPGLEGTTLEWYANCFEEMVANAG